MAVPTTGSTVDSNQTTTQAAGTLGSQSGSVNNQQQIAATQTGTQSGSQDQMNVYHPWQTDLQQTAGTAAGNYVTSGAPPPGVTGAPPQLIDAYVSDYNRVAAPQIAWAQGPGSPAIGSNLALGLEQLDANVYGTNLNAYQNAINQAGTLGFNSIGNTGTQGQTTTGTSGQTSSSDTNSSQNWQQAMADLMNVMNHSTYQGLGSI